MMHIDSEKFPPIKPVLHIFLAEDDDADCLLFQEALAELPVSAQLTIVHDGEQLMDLLRRDPKHLPDVLFLDLNMPRKNGFAALGEIKRDNTLDKLPVIIFTTANDQGMINQVFRDAAHYFIQKPPAFSELKNVIYRVLVRVAEKDILLPEKENFILSGK